MITLQEYHSRVELRREGSVNIYPAGSRMLPDFRRFLDRHSENPEALLWNPPFLECVLQDQEGFCRLARLEGEKMGGIPLSPLLAEAIRLASGRLPAIPDDLFQMKRLAVESPGRFHVNGAWRNFLLWKGAYVLADCSALPRLGSRFYYSPGDWSAIGRMKKLRTLKVENLAIGDFGFLAGLESLKHLNLGGTDFAQDAVLEGLKNLERLDLSGTGFSDCGILLRLPKLKMVCLRNCRLKNVEALADAGFEVMREDRADAPEAVPAAQERGRGPGSEEAGSGAEAPPEAGDANILFGIMACTRVWNTIRKTTAGELPEIFRIAMERLWESVQTGKAVITEELRDFQDCYEAAAGMALLHDGLHLDTEEKNRFFQTYFAGRTFDPDFLAAQNQLLYDVCGGEVTEEWLEELMETSVEGLAGRLFLGWDDRHSPGEWENIREAVRRSPAFACAAEGFQEDRRLAASGLPVPELRELFRNRCLFPEEDMERLSVRRAGETDPV